ncbi:hypothetical protein LQ564_07680 [Massilia sp. G4R7]|uniref:Uncharacterized protein n=1 Tax=Massilia phyllostachyos TaxID=2898585 RepID=A0ABS8Q382_9BURK|nr:hypothetical protein [Massilia phyllostachyos]MCD2516195.1 hypothetical protein [Massilia phyllostachyos]
MISPPLPGQGPHTVVRAMARARNRLLVRVRAAGRAPDAAFANLFGHLVAAVEAAFRAEEIQMEAIGFPGVREQRRDNAQLLSALHHAAARVESGELGVGREVVDALPCLLSLHRFCSLRVLAQARRTVHALRHARAPGPLARHARASRTAPAPRRT